MRVAFVPFPYRYGFDSLLNQVSTPLLLGELFENGDGTVRIERLYDAPEDQQDGGPLKPSRTFGIDINGNTTWRPAGTRGGYQDGRRVAQGVLYTPSGSDVTKPSFLVLVVTL